MQPDDAAAALPPISVEPTSAPFDLPETHKTCPDCARGVEAKGITYPRNPLRPIEEFYEQKGAKRFKGDVRHSAYCKPHQRKRNNAYRKGKGDPSAPERVKRWASAVGYEQRDERIEQKRKTARKQAKNKEAAAARAETWAKNNPDKRRKIARESAARRARGEPKRPPGPRTEREG